MFDVDIVTIDDKTISMRNVRQISLTSARLILVDDQGKQELISPGIIDFLSMFNMNNCAYGTMKGDD